MRSEVFSTERYLVGDTVNKTYRHTTYVGMTTLNLKSQ